MLIEFETQESARIWSERNLVRVEVALSCIQSDFHGELLTCRARWRGWCSRCSGSTRCSGCSGSTRWASSTRWARCARWAGCAWICDGNRDCGRRVGRRTGHHHHRRGRLGIISAARQSGHQPAEQDSRGQNLRPALGTRGLGDVRVKIFHVIFLLRKPRIKSPRSADYMIIPCHWTK